MSEAVPAGAAARRPEVAAVVLTVLGCLLGALGWPRPAPTASGWQVTAVPAALLVLLVGTAFAGLAVGTLLVRPSRHSPVVRATWWLLGLASVFAQVWNDLYLAALAGPGGIIPVFGWAFSFVPAAVLGLLTRRAGRASHRRAVLGTAVVTLPMVGLGWALYSSPDGVPTALLSALWSTGILGLLPVLLALAVTRPPPAPAPAPAGR
jgi:hypothetical protein